MGDGVVDLATSSDSSFLSSCSPKLLHIPLSTYGQRGVRLSPVQVSTRLLAELEPIEVVPGADTDKAGVEYMHNVEPSSLSSSSSQLVRPMQVPLSEFIAVTGRVDIRREMEKAQS